MLVVHFMRPANGFYISIIAAGKPFKALMNDYFMYQKISKPIQCYSKTYGSQPIYFVLQAKHDTQPTGYCKNEKEGIVFFKKTGRWLMMIFVQVPQKSMHNIAVCKPGNGLHCKETCEYYK